MDNMFNDDDDNETGLSKSDNLILDAFWEKLKPLREVSAPIADKEFRAKLAEHNTNFTILCGVSSQEEVSEQACLWYGGATTGGDRA